MALNTRLLHYIVFCPTFYALGTLLDPRNPKSTSAVQVHCLSDNKPIQIKDPFSSSWIKDHKFVAMEWYQLLTTVEGAKPKEETLLLSFLPNKTKIEMAKYSIFEFWGLQINDVGLDDSATYKAKLTHLNQTRERSVQIVVATPPVLESERLSVSRSVSEEDDQLVTLSCGRMASLGSPPVPFVWKTNNGTILPAVYQDGYLQLTLASEKDTGRQTCFLDLVAPASQCILDKDLPRFQGALTQSSRSESAGMTGIITGVVVGVVVAIVIIVIIVIIKRRRNANSEKYNAREHEKSRDKELGRDGAASLFKDEENPDERSQGPIYKGFIPAESYTITKLSEGNTDLIFKKIMPQEKSTNNMVYLNGERSPLKQGSGKSEKQVGGKDKQKQESDEKKGKQEKKAHKEEEEKPPQVSPRHIFLTPSMEELDKTGRTANGVASNEKPAISVVSNGRTANSVVSNGKPANGVVSNGKPANGVVSSGTVISHGTLV